MTRTKRVAIGTESPIKIRAVKHAFDRLGLSIEILPCKAHSGVNMQPIGLKEMEKGAGNRAADAVDTYPEADFHIGIEKGLVNQSGHWFDPTCVVILAPGGELSIAYGAFFPVPGWMAEEAVQHKTDRDIGIIVQRRAGGGEKDAMYYLSEGNIRREELLSQAVICALVPMRYFARYQE